MPLYIGLVHYPVYNKNGRVIASAVTTVDLHDIARAARTYEVSRFFVITPLEDQRELAQRVIRHWTGGYGAEYNPDRKEAMERVDVTPSLAEAEAAIENREGRPPLVMATDAGCDRGRSISYAEARDIIGAGRVVLVLFGTAWGLVSKLIERADWVLPPIEGTSGYNHLSVRSAAAIILDRLVGGYGARRAAQRV